MDTYQNWLVVSTPLKNISHLGLLFPIYGKIKIPPIRKSFKIRKSQTLFERVLGRPSSRDGRSETLSCQATIKHATQDYS
jgi:hypothetical protein